MNVEEIVEYLKQQMEYYRLNVDTYVEYKLTLDKLKKLKGSNDCAIE